MAAPLPDFLGLGTQKGGTTTLHRLLGKHPDVFLPACKEVHFFDQNYSSGEASDPGRDSATEGITQATNNGHHRQLILQAVHR